MSEPRQQRLFDDYRYFLYITDDWDSTPEEIVFDANDRCQQGECAAHAQCRSGLADAPLDNLLSNNAYMLITSLAWNLKAWFMHCVFLNPAGLKKAKQAEQKRGLLMMEFRTFVNFLVRVLRPSRTNWPSIGRVRLLAWNEWQSVFLRLVARLQRPLRC